MDRFTINLTVCGRLLRALHRHRDLGPRGLHIGILRSGSRCSPGHKWDGDSSRLDVGGVVHLDGRPDCLYRLCGYDNSSFPMGWTGGYVLLALLLAPYLRKFGKFTVSEFIGDRFYSSPARMVAVIFLLVASIAYAISQMQGVGLVCEGVVSFLRPQRCNARWPSSCTVRGSLATSTATIGRSR